MRLLKLTTLIALGALLMFTLPAFADTWTVISQPSQLMQTSFGLVPYGGGFAGGPPAGCGPNLCGTTDFGGGDGSLNQIGSLGPFLTFSNLQTEVNVPNSWATWNCPPATESCTPNALWNAGFSTLTTSPLATTFNTSGFELEPDNFAIETVQAIFNASDGSSFTLTLNPNGSAGALLFAVQDDTSGSHITSVDITDLAGGDFAIAQLRSGNSGTHHAGTELNDPPRVRSSGRSGIHASQDEPVSPTLLRGSVVESKSRGA